MKRLLCFGFLCVIFGGQAAAQELELPRLALKDEAALANVIPGLAKHAIGIYQEPDRGRYLSALFRLQIVAGQFQEAVTSLQTLVELRRATDPASALALLPFEMVTKARIRQAEGGISLDEAFKREFREEFGRLDDKAAADALLWFVGDMNQARNNVRAAIERQRGKNTDRIALADALFLIRQYHFYQDFQVWGPPARLLIAEDDARRYIADREILIKTPDGAQLDTMTVRPRSAKASLPSLFVFTIYADDERYFGAARKCAARGYVGVVAYSRGKGHSPNTPAPFEHDGDDARAAIDWIIKQPWSDGRVGMYGGSYDGFTQWAATKKLPPALKTIVPSRASNGGNGLPLENNVFLFANYAWTFYTTNNKYLDNETYNDRRWNTLNQKWYESGASYRNIDSIDGMPNKWFQTWLQHSSYDKYWQNMVPYKDEFSRINIPILTITGYYDDAQQSALWYLREHYKYDKFADHYLVIGPYDHFSTDRPRKDPVLRGYTLDPVAQLDTQELIFHWMDYIFRGARKPGLLKDKINYEVMGANEWKHAPSLERMSNEKITLYLTNLKSGDKYQLSRTKPVKAGYLDQTVDFADRKTTNNDYYPNPVVGKKPDLSNGFAFLSEPFDEAVEISGTFEGEIKAIINKKDVDIGVTLYEVMPNGELFHMSYFIGRASYARDMSVRHLLTPGKVEAIPFNRTRLTSRRLSKGSRLLITLNVNKNSFAQINYGTGKDVSDEEINDAKIPLQIRWRNDSYVQIPIWK
jgi:uncharacterized protein